MRKPHASEVPSTNVEEVKTIVQTAYGASRALAESPAIREVVVWVRTEREPQMNVCTTIVLSRRHPRQPVVNEEVKPGEPELLHVVDERYHVVT